MADQIEYEFDIAFSFLKDDEIIAYRVNDLIQDRVKSFIYSKNQEGLVGFDGEEKFHEVFSLFWECPHDTVKTVNIKSINRIVVRF